MTGHIWTVARIPIWVGFRNAGLLGWRCARCNKWAPDGFSNLEKPPADLKLWIVLTPDPNERDLVLSCDETIAHNIMAS